VAEDFFDHDALVNDRNHVHGMLALRADQLVGMPDLQDEVEKGSEMTIDVFFRF